MKILIYALLAIVFFSCDDKKEQLNTKLPECIENIIANEQSFFPLITIRQQEVNGENRYWLNTDARHLDGPEYIVNSSCDTICSYSDRGIPVDCIDQYGGWQIIWER